MAGNGPPGPPKAPGLTGTLAEPGSQLHPQSPAGGHHPGSHTVPAPLGSSSRTDLPIKDPSAPVSTEVNHVTLRSTATGSVVGEALYIRIGSVYKLEGFIDGKPVVYIGKANEIKVRIGSNSGAHKWDGLVKDPKTRVSIRKVYGRPNPQAAARGTMRSAQNEALLSQEEKALRETETEVGEYNRALRPGQLPKRVLNENRPAAGENMEVWQQRHSASSDAEWDVIKASGSSTITFRVFIGLQVIQMVMDALLQERDRKLARYVWATYVFIDADGESAFTLQEQQSWWGFVSSFRKKYISGPHQGTTVEIREEEFKALRDEAHALYGDVDWWGDFVPGLLMPQLPVAPAPPTYLDPSKWA